MESERLKGEITSRQELLSRIDTETTAVDEVDLTGYCYISPNPNRLLLY